MATDVQKAAIKKKAAELMATGIPMGQAAQEAYKQVMAIEPVETRVEKATKEAELDFAKKQLDFETTRSRYVSKKSADFQKSGADPATATQLANEEFDKNFMAPEVSPYEGTPPVKPSVPVTSEIMQPTVKTALRPQTFIPESGAKAEAKRAATPALLGESQGPKIDYKKLIEGYESSGLTRNDAIKQAQGFQATYGHNLVQLAAKYKAGGTVPPKNVAQEALDITLKDLQDLPTKLSDKSTYIKDAATKGIQDPLILAFSKQYEAGEGIPNLNEAQGKYVARVAELERKDAYERLKKEYEGKPIIVPDPTVSETRGGTKRTITLQGQERDKWLQSQAAGQVQTPWWTDPAEVKRRLAEPEKYGQQGVLTQETPLGSKQESTTGWLIRSALSPLNAVAGAVTPLVFEGLPFLEGGRQAKAIAEEGRRAARPEAYKESPVLYNIAQGRGFVGEAKDISDALGLDLIPVAGPVTLGTIYTAGLFAADMLDPTLDIVAAADKGAAAAFKASALAKEAGTSLKLGEAAKFGAKTAIEDFRSENAVASLFKKKGITPGDARLLIAEKMVPEAEAAVGKRALEGTELSKEVERLGSVDKAVESSPLLKQTVDDVKALRASVEGLEGERFITYDKLNEAMLEAEARNPTLLKDYGTSGEDFVKFLADKPEALKEVENALIRQSLRRGVFEATKGSIVDNKLVALTPNVFVSQDVAAKVMSDWSKSDLGQTISNLKNNPTFGKYAVSGKDKVAKPIVVISENTKLANGESLVENISNYLEQARLSGKHSAVDWSGFQKLPNGDTVVPLDVVRNIIDLKLEDAAKSFSYVSGKDISRLEPLASKAYTTPLETRDFSFSNLKKFTQAAIKKPSSPLTPVQEAFVDEVVSKVNNLDKQLRSDMTRIIKDTSFREAYGVPANLYDRNGLVGYLIAGPNSELQGLKDTLKTSVDNIFSSERYEPSIFNNIDGLDRKTYSDIWSDVGRTKLNAEIEKTANRIATNPATFAEELNGLTKVARELTKDEDNIIVSSSEIIDALKNKEKLPSEMLVGSYYNAETRRAYESTLNDLVEKQLGDLNVAFAHAQSESVMNWLSLVAANTKKFKNSGMEGVAGELISKYIANSMNTPGFAKKSVEEVYDIITSDIKFPMKKADKIGHADLVSFIEGESERIMKNNNLVARGDELDELLKLVKDVSKDWQNNDKAAQLKLFLGNKTGSEILSKLESGGAKEFEKGLRSLIISSNPNDAVSNLAKNTADTIRSIFYTSVLTAAPRFHGMNIIGAPSLIYSTTGLVPGIRDYSKAAEVMLRSDGAGGGKVILTDAAGRSYTADELWRAFSQGASRSNYDVSLPSMQAWLSNAEVVGKSEPMTMEK